ncbi:hypothetical protein OIU78_023139 [Salix suchowensis]|nr:hypothetical protein OIU78_023139 [Salix suchowensis]
MEVTFVLGNKWSAIAARLPGRTDNEIKNYWNTHIRKRLLRNGIDPVTHAPRLDLLDLSSILTTTTTDPKVPEPGEYSGFQSANNGYQNFSIDSVMSTPLMSQDPLNSSSTHVNSSSTEDERECYSSLLKFEIPESLDIDDFL